MKAAYVDTSCLVAVAFGEKGAASLGRRLEGFDELFSSNLLEAEFRASLVREEVDDAPDLLSWFTWVLPDQPLSREFGKVLAAGYLRGADLWHVGCALFLARQAERFALPYARPPAVRGCRAVGFCDLGPC